MAEYKGSGNPTEKNAPFIRSHASPHNEAFSANTSEVLLQAFRNKSWQRQLLLGLGWTLRGGIHHTPRSGKTSSVSELDFQRLAGLISLFRTRLKYYFWPKISVFKFVFPACELSQEKKPSHHPKLYIVFFFFWANWKINPFGTELSCTIPRCQKLCSTCWWYQSDGIGSNQNAKMDIFW